MRFAIDAHTVGQHLTGNEVYIRNLLQQLVALDRESDFFAYLCDGKADAMVPDRLIKRRVSTNPFARLGWDIPRHVKRDRPALLHVQYTGPLACDVPLVVSVHDVSFLEHPEYFTRARRWQLTMTVKRTVQQAAMVLCPSEFARHSILNAYEIPADRVAVVPNAVSSLFRPMQRDQAALRVRRKLGFAAPYILSVGDLQPRKNHLGLIRAFAALLAGKPQLPHHLVLVGKSTWYTETVRRAIAGSGYAGRIHCTDFVEDPDLVDLYNACEICVYPSFYEGFGLPIVEAMACGRAVACSNTTAMPEVANAAALLFNPHNDAEITRAMRDLLIDPDLRTRMERLGLQRAAQFSWERNARTTLDLYYSVAGRGVLSPALTLQPLSRT